MEPVAGETLAKMLREEVFYLDPLAAAVFELQVGLIAWAGDQSRTSLKCLTNKATLEEAIPSAKNGD